MVSSPLAFPPVQLARDFRVGWLRDRHFVLCSGDARQLYDLVHVVLMQEAQVPFHHVLRRVPHGLRLALLRHLSANHSRHLCGMWNLSNQFAMQVRQEKKQER